jgi:hypothetical protein
VAFELLRLHAAGPEGDDQGPAALPGLLARLLR